MNFAHVDNLEGAAIVVSDHINQLNPVKRPRDGFRASNKYTNLVLWMYLEKFESNNPFLFLTRLLGKLDLKHIGIMGPLFQAPKASATRHFWVDTSATYPAALRAAPRAAPRAGGGNRGAAERRSPEAVIGEPRSGGRRRR